MPALGALRDLAAQLAHSGQAFLDLANRPGTFKLPRDLGSTPAEIVANASTPKVPLTLMLPHEVAAKNEYLQDQAYQAAKRHVDKMAANAYAKGSPLSADDYAKRLDQAQAWNYAQHKNLQLFGNDENYLLTTPHGWAAITTPDLSDPTRTAIEALGLNSSGAPGGGGANAYQALLALTKQQGLTNFTKELTPENTVRKPMNLLSHIARTGDTSHLELDPSFWGPSGLGIGTPTAEEFSQLSVPAQLGYLANVGKGNADYALTQARYPHGLDTFMRDSAISPPLVGRDYAAIDPTELASLLGHTGPDSGVGDTALRQAMLTHALNGQYDLMGSSTPAFNVSRVPEDFTQGIMYAEGGAVKPNPHEGMEHNFPAASSTEAPLGGLRQWAQHLAHRALHPLDPSVMAETAQSLKDQFGVGRPLTGLGDADVTNAMNFINPVGAEGKALAAAMAGVIKPRGGQWLPDTVNSMVENLKDYGPMLSGDILNATEPGLHQAYLNDTGNGMLPMHGWVRAKRPDLVPQLMGPSDAINNWTNKQLRRYVMTDMGTPEDPIRQLADQGISHTNYMNLPGSGTKAKRATGQLGATDLGKAWENAADKAIDQGKASSMAEATSMFGDNTPSWLAKLASSPETADTPIYELGHAQYVDRDLGFDHLTDELYNAMRPDSDLPQNLRLAPEKLNNVSVPDAVKLVSKINDWRAKQAAEANQAVANNAATHLVKDYGDGMRWVELRAPEGATGNYLGNGKYEDDATNALKDALKYEGDQMGHCVGGYCPSVQNGSSRIFSLRDAQGNPHVTIETRPPQSPEVTQAQYAEHARQIGLTPDDLNPDYVAQQAAAWSKPSDRIQQIKGKGNAAPVDKYLPYVQDFVKTQGPWSDVGDLKNTGLLDYTKPSAVNNPQLPSQGGNFFAYSIPPGYHTPGEVADQLIGQGADPLHAIQHAGAYDHPLLQNAEYLNNGWEPLGPILDSIGGPGDKANFMAGAMLRNGVRLPTTNANNYAHGGLVDHLQPLRDILTAYHTQALGG